jgi:hypothetical protein
MNSALELRSTQSAHLSDDQIDDHLIGDLAAEPTAHLADCADCTLRVTQAAAPIASFDNVSMAWSERRSATLPLPGVAAQRPLWQRHMNSAMAGFTFVLGIALINADHQFAPNVDLQPAPHNSTLQAVAPAPALTGTARVTVPPAAAQVSADNQMLQAVDAETQPSADTPSALGLEPVSNTAPRPRPTVSAQFVQD